MNNNQKTPVTTTKIQSKKDSFLPKGSKVNEPLFKKATDIKTEILEPKISLSNAIKSNGVKKDSKILSDSTSQPKKTLFNSTDTNENRQATTLSEPTKIQGEKKSFFSNQTISSTPFFKKVTDVKKEVPKSNFVPPSETKKTSQNIASRNQTLKNGLLKNSNLSLKNQKKSFENLWINLNQKVNLFTVFSRKKSLKFHQNTHNHFHEIVNNTQTYLIDIKNYKNLVNLHCGLSYDNQAFNLFIDKLLKAIQNRKQIIFDNFIISWEKGEKMLDYPVLINDKKKLKNSLLVEDFQDGTNPDLKKVYVSLNRIINYQLKTENLKLLLNDYLLVMQRNDGAYALLFSEGLFK